MKAMGKGSGQTSLPQSSPQQLLPQLPLSQSSLEGSFGRVWLDLWCVYGEEVILYFRISQVTGRLGEGPKALASIQGAALVLLTSSCHHFMTHARVLLIMGCPAY